MSESIYTALVKRTSDYWIAWVQEIPGVNAQERSKEEMLVSLKHALREEIKSNRADARKAAVADYAKEPIALL